jgi:TetR/AcrR family transcriptional regulator, transcriptional repressor of bet genes
LSRASVTQARRQQIVDGMYALMVGRGYEAATIRRIAIAARLTPGLIHYHFKNKLEILRALLEHLETVHTRYLDFDLLVAEDPAEKVAVFIDHHLSSGRETANPEAVSCWAVVSGEAHRQPGFAEEVENAFKRITGKLAAILRAGIETGAFKCQAPEAAAAALVAAIHGYLCVATTTLDVIPYVSAAPCVKMMAAGLLQTNSPCLRDAAVPSTSSDATAPVPSDDDAAVTPAFDETVPISFSDDAAVPSTSSDATAPVSLDRQPAIAQALLGGSFASLAVDASPDPAKPRPVAEGESDSFPDLDARNPGEGRRPESASSDDAFSLQLDEGCGERGS